MCHTILLPSGRNIRRAIDLIVANKNLPNS
jgi:hypothetical protein